MIEIEHKYMPQENTRVNNQEFFFLYVKEALK